MNIEAYFKITYGLYVVSSVNGKKLNGYISNTVFQVTADPEQLCIACSKNNFTSELIKTSNVFTISALRKDTRQEIFGTFGYKSGRDVDKFSNFNYKIGSTGAPILLEDSVAWFECEVVQTFDVGSHLLFVGRVIDSDLLNESAEPLTYAYYRDIKKGKAPKNAPTFIDPEKLKKKVKILKTDKYYCPVCGYIYDPESGDPASGISPGTRFEDLPDNWVCPVCGTGKAEFIRKE